MTNPWTSQWNQMVLPDGTFQLSALIGICERCYRIEREFVGARMRCGEQIPDVEFDCDRKETTLRITTCSEIMEPTWVRILARNKDEMSQALAVRFGLPDPRLDPAGLHIAGFIDNFAKWLA